MLRILAIETSCDETAVAVVDFVYDKKLSVLTNTISSQIEAHSTFGGVVPELAARMHADNILPVLQLAFDEVMQKTSLTRTELIESIDMIAVTQGPGLLPALSIGIETAKALAVAWGKPLQLVNHIYAHLVSPAIDLDSYTKLFPLVSVIVSGGNTAMYYMKSPYESELIGDTMDDAVGEAFDKVGKLLGLGYPGGPRVSKKGKEGIPTAFAFPRPMIHTGLNFSFAGLKTSVLYTVRDLAHDDREGALGQGVTQGSLSESQIADVCASFEQAAIDVLIHKFAKATEEYGTENIFIGGGVAANTLLQQQSRSVLERQGKQVFIAQSQVTGDNAVMIAYAAGIMHHADLVSVDSLTARPLPQMPVLLK